MQPSKDMQKNAAFRITESTDQGSEPQNPPGKNPEIRPQGQVNGESASYTGPEGSLLDRALSGSGPDGLEKLSEKAPATGEQETPEGHIYDLGERISEEAEAKANAEAKKFAEGDKAPHTEFPEQLFRLPVPNEVFRELPRLSGAEVRGALLLIRAAFRYDPEQGWSASPRYFTASDLAEVPAQGAGMSQKSIVRAMRALEKIGWADVREAKRGRPHRFRCLLSAPSRGFTWLPSVLFEVHARLSNAALQVLLCIYRETWGWTRYEERKGGETLVHRVRAPLSNADLAEATGLHVSTVRRGAKTLRHVGLIERERPHQASPFFYRATEPESAPNQDKSHTPTSRVKNLIHRQARARGNRQPSSPTGSDNRQSVEHTKGEDKEGKPDRKRRNRPCRQPPSELLEGFSDKEQEQFQKLTGSGFDVPPAVAAELVNSRSTELVEQTLEKFYEEQESIDNPGGWIRKALEETWLARTTESEPNRRRKKPRKKRRGSTEKPLGKLFEEMIGENQGWEDKSTEGNRGKQTPPKNLEGKASPEADAKMRPSNRQPGVTHSKMCDLIDALNQPPGDWNCIQRDGQPNLFVPSKELARWAWNHQDSGSDRFQRAAKRVIEARKRHESR